MFVCFLTNTTLFHPKINRSYVSGRGFCVPVIPGAILSRALALVGSPKANWPWVGETNEERFRVPCEKKLLWLLGPNLGAKRGSSRESI